MCYENGCGIGAECWLSGSTLERRWHRGGSCFARPGQCQFCHLPDSGSKLGVFYVLGLVVFAVFFFCSSSSNVCGTVTPESSGCARGRQEGQSKPGELSWRSCCCFTRTCSVLAGPDPLLVSSDPVTAARPVWPGQLWGELTPGHSSVFNEHFDNYRREGRLCVSHSSAWL